MKDLRNSKAWLLEVRYWYPGDQKWGITAVDRDTAYRKRRRYFSKHHAERAAQDLAKLYSASEYKECEVVIVPLAIHQAGNAVQFHANGERTILPPDWGCGRKDQNLRSNASGESQTSNPSQSSPKALLGPVL